MNYPDGQKIPDLQTELFGDQLNFVGGVKREPDTLGPTDDLLGLTDNTNFDLLQYAAATPTTPTVTPQTVPQIQQQTLKTNSVFETPKAQTGQIQLQELLRQTLTTATNTPVPAPAVSPVAVPTPTPPAQQVKTPPNIVLQSQLAAHLAAPPSPPAAVVPASPQAVVIPQQTTTLQQQLKTQKIIVQQPANPPQQIIINAQPASPPQQTVQTVGQVNLQQLQQVNSNDYLFIYIQQQNFKIRLIKCNMEYQLVNSW